MTTATEPAPNATPFTAGEHACSFRPLTVADRCDFEKWSRDELIAFLGRQDGITPDALFRAGITSIGLGWNSPELVDLAASQRGTVRLLWLATRHSHDLTPEQFAEALTDEQLHAGVGLLLDSFSFPAGVVKTDTPKPSEPSAGPVPDAAASATAQ